MPSFRETALTDATAQALLTEYFDYRASVFPVAGGYRTTFPDPAAFSPPRGVFLIAEEAGEPLGCGGIRGLSGAVFEVKHVWTRPRARGRGIARLLLAELERCAHAFGADALVLDTHDSLDAANALYRGLGYREVPAYNDNPNATRWYRKPLGAAEAQ